MWGRLAAIWRRRAPAAGEPAEDWFTAESLADFPLEAVRPYLAGHPLGRLHTAWVLALTGHEPAWIARHLGLPEAVAVLLVEAVNRRDH
ncbi:hypothetical protein [Kitasatospora sp. GAS1066B]|uniref:hypothetical protein n=1 Tax=Kitasatospora sp. GAS1066B TaxID=3156271 RepID=UPI0035136B6F